MVDHGPVSFILSFRLCSRSGWNRLRRARIILREVRVLQPVNGWVEGWWQQVGFPSYADLRTFSPDELAIRNRS